VAVLALALLGACSSERQPPIAAMEVSSQIVAQLAERFGDRSIKVDAISYDSAKDAFAVTLTYEIGGEQREHAFSLLRYVDEKRPSAKYAGQVPIELFGEQSPHGKTFCQVTIEQSPD
jgi:hypothetical protein